MSTLSGKLLIAAPRMSDPNFGRSVVLVIHHQPEGAFGLVLNRPGGQRLAAVWEETVQEPCPLDAPLYIGGPVEGPLMALHADLHRSEKDVAPGVHFARDKDHLLALVADAHQPLRVFAGYSGWGRGQLEQELERGDWTVTTATAPLVFGDEATMWRRVARHAADEAIVATLRIKHVPGEPWHN